MIRLTRPDVPAGHAVRASKGTKKLWEEWNNTGVTPKAKSSIYAHPSVKEALKNAQHHKCAYCETLNPTSHDVVEHFRPKNGWQQKRGDALGKPAYFWLSYEWENLLFACDVCNDAAHKGNLFPLAIPSARADAANPDVANEKPLLINPYIVDPDRHIEWSKDIPRPRNKSRMGRKSIEVFGLDHDGLMMDKRRQYLNEIELSIKLANALSAHDSLRKELVINLHDCLKDSAPWAAMIRANFKDRILAL